MQTRARTRTRPHAQESSDILARGRKRKPEELRQADGYPDKRPPRSIKKARVGLPPMPESLHPLAREHWRAITPELERLKLITRLDHACLLEYIETYSECARLRELLQETGGHMVASEKFSAKGVLLERVPKRSPLSSALKEYLTLLRAYAGELGFTPTARAKVGEFVTQAASDMAGGKQQEPQQAHTQAQAQAHTQASGADAGAGAGNVYSFEGGKRKKGAST